MEGSVPETSQSIMGWGFIFRCQLWRHFWFSILLGIQSNTSSFHSVFSLIPQRWVLRFRLVLFWLFGLILCIFHVYIPISSLAEGLQKFTTLFFPSLTDTNSKFQNLKLTVIPISHNFLFRSCCDSYLGIVSNKWLENDKLLNFTLPFNSLWDNESETQTIMNWVLACCYQSARKMQTSALLMWAIFEFLEWTK